MHVVTAYDCSDDFTVEAGVLQGDTLAPYLFVIIQWTVSSGPPYILDDSLGFKIRRRLSRRHPAKYVTDRFCR